MCYSGQCKHEDYMGECTLGQLQTKQNGFPEDAICMITNKEAKEAEKEIEKEVLENE